MAPENGAIENREISNTYDGEKKQKDDPEFSTYFSDHKISIPETGKVFFKNNSTWLVLN